MFKSFKYFLYLLFLKNIYCINNNISNTDVKAIGHVMDFQQCIEECNQIENVNDCKLNCYIDFGSLGYKNNFSFGVAPDKLMSDISSQVKAFKISDIDSFNNNSNNDEQSKNDKLLFIYNNTQSLIKDLKQKYSKTMDNNNDNIDSIPLTRKNILELFRNDNYISSAFNNISDSTFSTLKKLTKNIEAGQNTNSNMIDTLLYTALNNNFGNLLSDFTSKATGRITKNIIQSSKKDFSEDECISRCNASSEHLSSVFNNITEEFDEQVLDENSIKDIHEHCINQCHFINEVYEVYGNMDINDINKSYKVKRSFDKNKLNRSNGKCNNKIKCENANGILECNYEDNKPFFNRIDGCSIPDITSWSFSYDKTILLPSCHGHDACYHCNPVDTDTNSDIESMTTEEYLNCNKKLRENGRKACDIYDYGSKFDKVKGKIKCYQEVESMVLAVDVAGWKSFKNDRTYTNDDTTGCLCNRSIREISGKNFLIKHN